MGKKNRKTRRPAPTDGRFSRKALIAAAAVLAGLFAALAAFAILRPGPLRVSFYGIDDGERKAFEEVLAARKSPGRNLAFKALNPDLPLSAQEREVRRSSILILKGGAAAASLAGGAVPPKDADLALMPSAIRGAGRDDSARYGLPVLLDFFELAWNGRILSLKGFGKPASLGDLEAAGKAVKKPTLWPIVCAGAEDADLSMFAGAVVEAAAGGAALDRLAELAASGKKIGEISRDPLVAPGLALLARWRSEGLLHPEWLSIDGRTLEALMAGDAAAYVFMPLSRHRTIAQKTIEKYDSTFVPAANARRERAFIAPSTVAVRVGAKRKDADADALFSALVSAPVQKALAAESGLAPVGSSAETRDIQAANARLWAAASSGPRSDPLAAAFPDPSARKAFAGDLREWLRGQ